MGLVPTPEFEEEGAPPNSHKTANPTSPISPTHRSTRLSRYLDDLNLRANEPPYDLNEQNFRHSASAATLQASASMSMGFSSAPSRASLMTGMNTAQGVRNPEADSFTYLETLLESLAVLGKLGIALDTVTQKLPQEIFSLVETTLDEVAERAEYSRRMSTLGPLGNGTNVGRSNDVYFLTGAGPSDGFIDAMTLTLRTSGQLLPASSLRLTALEMSTKRVDQEVMKDLFWTLYSKLDAVTQGLRVMYEVSNRIGSVNILVSTLFCILKIPCREETLRTRPGPNLGRYSR